MGETGFNASVPLAGPLTSKRRYEMNEPAGLFDAINNNNQSSILMTNGNNNNQSSTSITNDNNNLSIHDGTGSWQAWCDQWTRE
jgi:hypothetical protein